jgi:hypothetical protein
MSITTSITTQDPQLLLKDGTSLLDLVDETGGHVSRRIYTDRRSSSWSRSASSAAPGSSWRTRASSRAR